MEENGYCQPRFLIGAMEKRPMPRTCTICKHSERGAIDTALVSGEPFRNIAARFATSSTALFRHKRRDIPAALAIATQVAEVVHADNLLDRLKQFQQETAAILREARATKDNDLALRAIARAEKQLELEARLIGELDDRARVAVAVGVQAEQAPDLSGLSDHELAQLRSLLERAEATARR
jgi:hypothetical protein